MIKKRINRKHSKKKSKNKKKKKKHYITGTHHSKKCETPIKFRSSWEKTVCEWFDNDNNIISYTYENIKIEYISNLKTGKIRNYYPDFFVIFNDGTEKLIEVKRKSQVNNQINIKKFHAAKLWCKKKNVQFELITDDQIKEYRKLLK